MTKLAKSSGRVGGQKLKVGGVASTFISKLKVGGVASTFIEPPLPVSPRPELQIMGRAG
jgi:hypothetical protein